MAAFVDGFVIPVPRAKLAQYRRLARRACQVWMEHGALEYSECVAEDMNAHGMLPFPRLARVKKGEVVVFSWITYRSRAHRDRVNARVLADPRILCRPEGKDSPPFDCRRMAYGGFRRIILGRRT